MSGSFTLLDTIKPSFGLAGSYTGTLEANLQVVLPEDTTDDSQRKDGFLLGASLSCAGLSWDLSTHGVCSLHPWFKRTLPWLALCPSSSWTLSSGCFHCKLWYLTPEAIPSQSHKEPSLGKWRIERREPKIGWVQLISYFTFILFPLEPNKPFPVRTYSWLWSWTLPQIHALWSWATHSIPFGLSFLTIECRMHKSAGTWSFWLLLSSVTR